jgi:hypothetical protein
MHDQPVLDHGHRDKLVTVTIDGNVREIRRGKYLVSELKRLLGVPAEYELDEVKHGHFKPLDDAAHTIIEGCEVFVSHVRCGGAS